MSEQNSNVCMTEDERAYREEMWQRIREIFRVAADEAVLINSPFVDL